MRYLLACACTAMLAASAAAEVAVQPTSGGGVELVFTPAATGPWARVRNDLPNGARLNAQGDARGDSWPSFTLHPTTGSPDVAWSSAGEEGEIYLSWFANSAWRTPMNVSSRAGSDHGVALDRDAWGNRFLAWSNSRSGHVGAFYTSVRNDGTAQTTVRELSSRQREGRRPSLKVDGDTGNVYVAFEEQANGNDDVPYIAIDRITPVRDPDLGLHCSGENGPDLMRTATIRTAIADARLVADVRVESRDGELWVTWIDSRSQVGWVQLVSDGVFSSPQYRPLDPARGYDGAREDIEDAVLGP